MHCCIPWKKISQMNPSEVKHLFPKWRFRIIQLKQTIRKWLFRVPAYQIPRSSNILNWCICLFSRSRICETSSRVFCLLVAELTKNLRVQETFHVSNRPGYARMFQSFLGNWHWKFSSALPLTPKKVLERPSTDLKKCLNRRNISCTFNSNYT